jgi:hypothetical protein
VVICQQSAPLAPAQTKNTWANQQLYEVLNNMSLTTQQANYDDLILDSGASSHMASQMGLHSLVHSSPSSSRITVGNNAHLPMTPSSSTSTPTSPSPLHQHIVLINPTLTKNLLSTCALTHDNFVYFEFDPFGFSIKDYRTKKVLLRYGSTGKFYPLRGAHAYLHKHSLIVVLDYMY